MELNAEQIKKALEWCSSGGNCIKCAEDEKNPRLSKEGCMALQMGNALALITSQEQRIGAQDMTISELRKNLEKANHDDDRYAAKIKELTERNEIPEAIIKALEENKRLTEENKRLRFTIHEAAKSEKENLRVTEEIRSQIKELLPLAGLKFAEAKADTVREIFGKLESKLRISFINGDEENAMLVIGYDDYVAIKKEMGGKPR